MNIFVPFTNEKSLRGKSGDRHNLYVSIFVCEWILYNDRWTLKLSTFPAKVRYLIRFGLEIMLNELKLIFTFHMLVETSWAAGTG